MFSKRNKIILGLIIIVGVVFGISYRWGIEKYTSVKNKNERQKSNLEKYTIISDVDRVLPSNTKIILKLKLKDSTKEITLKELSLGDLQSEISGKITFKSVEDYFDKMGYKLLSNKDDEIVFVKNTMYKPEKYYIGSTKDGFIAIYKCDSEGNLIIEDPVKDISSKKVEAFPINDQKSINNFEFEFDTKEEASEELTSIIS